MQCTIRIVYESFKNKRRKHIEQIMQYPCKTLVGSDSTAYASPIILNSLSASLCTSSAIAFQITSSPLSNLAKNWLAYNNIQLISIELVSNNDNLEYTETS